MPKISPGSHHIHSFVTPHKPSSLTTAQQQAPTATSQHEFIIIYSLTIVCIHRILRIIYCTNNRHQSVIVNDNSIAGDKVGSPAWHAAFSHGVGGSIDDCPYFKQQENVDDSIKVQMSVNELKAEGRCNIMSKLSFSNFCLTFKSENFLRK